MSYGYNPSHDIVDGETTLFWFRRDLRLNDNAGLYHALRDNAFVLGLFIFDTEILDTLDDKHDKRVQFIHKSLEQLKLQLERIGTSLLVLTGKPSEVFKTLAPSKVYTNHDYEPYAIQRDAEVKTILKGKGSDLLSFKDQVIFEKDEIVKGDGEPYTVFTPYSKKWKQSLTGFMIKNYPVEKYCHRFKKTAPCLLPCLKDIGFINSDVAFPSPEVSEDTIKNYHHVRDFPALLGTSRISVHLRFGTVSIRKMVQLGFQRNETWLNELIWREFYQMILWHFPKIVSHSFKSSYDHIQWSNDEHEFMAWCQGKTGYPIVDAGMRELNSTGFMHNRVRMIVASFLTKHLLIDWRWGEAYFAKKLLDYDLASNNGGWQWAAGTGCDAAPYFRIFNPKLQTEKFDPELTYIRKWIPELDTSDYPQPIVEHTFARERAIKTYKAALDNASRG
jgi:deoxyribodipyrimidine photo-lyase